MLWIVRVCSSGVASLKTVVCLCMMIRDLKNSGKNRKCAPWLWMNFLRCFWKLSARWVPKHECHYFLGWNCAFELLVEGEEMWRHCWDCLLDEHTRTILSFITIYSFYLIININWNFSLLNKIMIDAAYFALGGRLDWHFSRNLLSHRQFSMYSPRTGLIVEGRNQATWECSQHVKKNLSGRESISTLTFWTCLIYKNIH